MGDNCVSATVEEVCSVHTRRHSNSLFNVVKTLQCFSKEGNPATENYITKLRSEVSLFS
jgi:hypothetical protein